MRSRRHRLQVSTFPFMAVLLCAMGALILLLLIMDRRAKMAARHATQQRAAIKEKNDAEKARQQQLWEQRQQELLAMLRQEKGQLQREIKDVQQQLSETEKNIQLFGNKARTIDSDIDKLNFKLSRVSALVDLKKDELQKWQARKKQKESQLGELLAELQNLEKTLELTVLASQQQQNRYSLVPYRGPRGASRQPVYLECTKSGVIFHPGSQHFSFEETTHLDIRLEINKRIQSIEPNARLLEKKDRPYVFMLIRPDGLRSYYETRACMLGLDYDFGYELIDADWKLDFSADKAFDFANLAKSSSKGSTSGLGRGGSELSPDGHGRGGDSEFPNALAKNSNPENIGNGGISGYPKGQGNPGGNGNQNGLSSGSNSGRHEFGGGLADGKQIGIGIGTNGSPLHQNGKPGASNGDGNSITIFRPAQNNPAGGGTPELLPPLLPQMPLGDATGKAGNSHIPGGQPSIGSPQNPYQMGKNSGKQPNSGAGSFLKSPNEANTGLAQPASPIPELVPLPRKGQLGPNPNSMTNSSENQTSQQASSNNSSGQKRDSMGQPGTPQMPGTNGSDAEPESPFGTVPGVPSKKAKSTPLPTIRRSRDWHISIVCRADGITVPTLRKQFPIGLLNTADTQHPLTTELHNMIQRRQQSLPPGSQQYRPIVRFEVHEDGLRSYYLAYPLVEPLGIPMERENIRRRRPDLSDYYRRYP